MFPRNLHNLRCKQDIQRRKLWSGYLSIGSTNQFQEVIMVSFGWMFERTALSGWFSWICRFYWWGRLFSPWAETSCYIWSFQAVRYFVFAILCQELFLLCHVATCCEIYCRSMYEKQQMLVPRGKRGPVTKTRHHMTSHDMTDMTSKLLHLWLTSNFQGKITDWRTLPSKFQEL